MSRKAKKTLFIVLLVILAGIVAFLAFRIYRSQVESREMRAQLAAQQEAEAQAEETTPTPTETPTPTATPTPTDTPTPTPTAAPVMVSFRGDTLEDSETDPTKGYPELFQQLLEQNGYSSVKVEDDTWENRGSLSQLALAGVSTDNLQTFIDGHTNNGLTDLTELQISDDVADVQKDRDDLSAIPVLCMGFYGGWGQDVSELIQQYNLMLSTYDQTDKYIILGVYPNAVAQGIIDAASFDSAMQEQFGDHYVQLDGTVLDQPAFTDEGHQEIAQALYDKMVSLGYLDGSTTTSTDDSDESVSSTSGTETTEAADTMDTADTDTADTADTFDTTDTAGTTDAGTDAGETTDTTYNQ